MFSFRKSTPPAESAAAASDATPSAPISVSPSTVGSDAGTPAITKIPSSQQPSSSGGSFFGRFFQSSPNGNVSSSKLTTTTATATAANGSGAVEKGKAEPELSMEERSRLEQLYLIESAHLNPNSHLALRKDPMASMQNRVHIGLDVLFACAAYFYSSAMHIAGQSNALTTLSIWAAGTTFLMNAQLRRVEGEERNDIYQYEVVGSLIWLLASFQQFRVHKRLKWCGYSSWMALGLSTYYSIRYTFHYMLTE